MRHLVLSILLILSFFSTLTAQIPIVGSRLGENFDTVTLVERLSDPWELTWGPDNYLWVTESRGYTIRRVHPTTGANVKILDLTPLRNFPRYDKISDAIDGGKPWPQGGLEGMAIHPQFNSGKPYVYLTYVHTYSGSGSAGTGCLTGSQGCFYTSRIVRYEYDAVDDTLINPITLVDTIPGSNDHNSGRLLIPPVNGVYYLFSSVGDMGGGQFSNGARPIRAQDTNIYEGKILRFNLEPDADADTYDRWIPSDNPFNGSVQSAVWSIGHRNVQGLTYGVVNGTGFMYAAEHGPFSDDEVNIIEKGKNYGHPLVIGANDGNYDGAAAGASSTGSLPGAHNSSAPIISSESANATSIGADFRGPIKTFYSPNNATLLSIFNAVIGGNSNNSGWPSDGISSVEFYGGNAVPNWYNSIFVTTLKGGKIIRLKLNTTGDGIVSLAGADTVNYFRSTNRFRDIAFSPDGRTMYAIIDSSSITSGPTSGNPAVITNRGALMKFTYVSGGILNLRNDTTRPVRKEYSVQVYPNPTNKFIVVSFEIGVHKPVGYQLVDMAGRVVLQDKTQQNVFTINVSHLRRGLYILKLFNGYGVEVKMEKMVVN